MDTTHLALLLIAVANLVGMFLLVLRDPPSDGGLTRKERKGLLLGGNGLSLMERRGREFASSAVKYAEQLGGTAEQKRAHALGAFRILDLRDGKRDYPDAQARVLIEAAVKETK